MVSDQKIVWASGFGHEDPKNLIPADANTVYRVGSVSKLFTEMAIMQRVEKGELNLDAPIQKYWCSIEPTFNSFIRPTRFIIHNTLLFII